MLASCRKAPRRRGAGAGSLTYSLTRSASVQRSATSDASANSASSESSEPLSRNVTSSRTRSEAISLVYPGSSLLAAIRLTAFSITRLAQQLAFAVEKKKKLVKMSHMLSPPPQSPFPCTPSTLGGSSPPSAQYFQHFRSSTALAGSLISKLPARHAKQESASTTLPESADGSPRTPASDSSPSMPGSVDASPESSLPAQRAVMKSHPSTASIPIILAGLGMMDSLGGEKGGSPDAAAGMKPSPSMHSIAEEESQDPHVENGQAGKRRASIGLGILQAPIEIVDGLKPPLSPLTEVSDPDTAADTSTSTIQSLHEVGDHASALTKSNIRQHGSAASAATTLVDEVKERQDRIGSWTSSLLSVGGSSSADTASTLPTPEPSPRGQRFGLPGSTGKPGGPGEEVPSPTERFFHPPPRLDSLQLTRIEPPLSSLEAEIDAAFGISSIPVERQRQQEQRNPSAQSDFSVSAYNYSPYLGSAATVSGLSPQLASQKSRWSLRSGESKTVLLSPGGRNVESAGLEISRQRQVSVVLSTTSSKGDQNSLMKVKEKVRSRKRAVTLSNGIPAEKKVEKIGAISPTAPSHKQQAGFATLTARQRALFAADYKLYPVSSSDVFENPLSPNSLRALPAGSPTSAQFQKPLPAVPSLKADRPRTGESSRPGTGRKASSTNLKNGGSTSRPGTASAAAKAFGLIASPPQAFSNVVRSTWSDEYQSVHSRDSLESAVGHERAWAGPPTSLSICIDQENFRNIAPVFKRSSVDNTLEKVVYLAALPGKAYPYHHASMDPVPTLRRVTVEGDRSTDIIGKEAVLPIKQSGVYSVDGTEGKGSSALRWSFVYQVCERTSLVGRALPGEKNIIPMSFTCSPQLFNPAFARKSKVLSTVYKTLSSRYEAVRIGDLPADFFCERG